MRCETLLLLSEWEISLEYEHEILEDNVNMTST